MESCKLPEPPKIYGAELSIPPYYHSGHPYTKWMLNMLRGGASFRINTMLKERPEIFQQIYQIPDIPEVVSSGSNMIAHSGGIISGACGGGGSGQPYDTLPMFNRHTVLYLNPLCLAVYLKKEKSAQLILKSGLNRSNQKCWATEIFSRTQTGSGDIMEIYPVFIAIRREYFEVIPILVNQQCGSNVSIPLYTNMNNNTVLSTCPKLSVGGCNNNEQSSDSFSISDRLDARYESRELKKIFRYRDCLQYALDTLKKRGNLPVSRLIELFIIECPTSLPNTRLESDKEGNLNSLFYRIVRMAYFDDNECRISMQLIQCLDVLLKHKFVPWTPGIDVGLAPSNKGDIKSAVSKDFSTCFTLLLALYNKIQTRVKNGPLDNLGYLIIKTLQHVQWKDQFCQQTPELLLHEFGRWNDNFIISIETICIIKKHIKAILDLEKERELKINSFNNKSRGVVFSNKTSHQRSLSLKDKTSHNNYYQLNLLQCRNQCTNFLQTSPNQYGSVIQKVNKFVETVKTDDMVPLYSYQTGSIQAEGKPNSDNGISISKNQQKCSIVNNTDDLSDCSSTSSTNCLEMAPVVCNIQPNNDTTIKFVNNSRFGTNCEINANTINNPYSINNSNNDINYALKHNRYSPIEINKPCFNQDNIEIDESESNLTNNLDLIDFEDEVLNELFNEYNNFNSNNNHHNHLYTRHSYSHNSIGDIPLYSKRNRNYVNNTSKYLFSRM